MYIRHTTKEELDEVKLIFDNSRKFMAENGNPNQWGTDWPPMSMIEEDIELNRSYICVENGLVLGTFMFSEGPEPLYEEFRANWLNDDPYHVVHRIATGGSHRGVGAFCLDWAFQKSGNIRIDTHGDNKPMQGLLKKLGFSYCGLTRSSDGTPRLAYQKCLPQG